MNSETPIETVERLARLARITIAPEKKEGLAREFESVLAYIAQLDELDIAVGGTPRVPALHNVLRADENPTAPGTHTEAMVQAFPAREGNALSVKKIISHD